MTEQRNDLEILFPDGVSIKVGTEEVKVMPFTFGQLPFVMKRLVPLVRVFSTSGVLSFGKDEKGSQTIELAKNWPMYILDVLAEGGEPLMELVAYTVGKQRSWMDTVQTDEGIALVKALVEVNSDFFSKKVLPTLPGMKTTVLSGGETSQVSSSQVDTALKT